MKKIVFLFWLLIAFCSCKNESCGRISLQKLDFQEGCVDTNDNCMDYYVAKCVDLQNEKDIDTLNFLISRAYSREKAKKFYNYVISVLKYGKTQEDGFNNNSDFSSKYWFNTLGEHPNWFLAKYIWHKNIFDSMYHRTNSKLVGANINMDSLANLK